MQLKIRINGKQHTFLSFKRENVDDLRDLIIAVRESTDDDKVNAFMLDHYDDNNDGKTSYDVYKWNRDNPKQSIKINPYKIK